MVTCLTHRLVVSPPSSPKKQGPFWNMRKPEHKDSWAWRSGDSEPGRELPERIPGPLDEPGPSGGRQAKTEQKLSQPSPLGWGWGSLEGRAPGLAP